MPDSPKTPAPHELAARFQTQIKATVAEKYSLAVGDLSLLLEDQNGIYLSKIKPHVLCCFVVGLKNGRLYLVIAKIEKSGMKLSGFKCQKIA